MKKKVFDEKLKKLDEKKKEVFDQKLKKIFMQKKVFD